MKKLLTFIGLGVSLLTVKGIDTSLLFTNQATAVPAYTNVILGPCRIQLLSVVNPNNTNFTFAIYDAPNPTNTWAGQSQIYTWTNFVTNLVSGGPLSGWPSGIAYSNGPYNAVVQYTTNIKVFYTNFMGITNFQGVGPTNAAGAYFYTNNPVWASNVLWTTTNTVAGFTNGYRVLFSGVVGGNATLTITNQFNCIYGLGILHDQSPGTGTVNVTWSSSL